MTAGKKRVTLVDNARQFGDDLLQAGQKIWFAGLGVVSLVGEETTGTFGKLVDRGEKVGDKKFPIVDRARSLGRRIEDTVQNTVGSTLNRAGVPSTKEVHSLIQRVEELTQKVDALGAQR